jgi:glycosyltransferase involved in cell wall biosynthesis
MKHQILFLLFLILYSFPLIGQEELLIQEKPIVVIIPSYCNSTWCEWNLSSVFEQNYKNYRVIYIDDCSTDNTYDLVVATVNKYNAKERIQIIRNTTNQGALANIYMACHAAQDHEIIVTLDGDDALAHANVLFVINHAYQDPNVWMTYGQYCEYPEGWLGICHPIPQAVIANNAYRSYEWVTSHIRTYYAWLFKRIKKEDLMYEDAFYPTTADLAIMFPMLEMAGGRFAFIDQILYIHNQANPLNDFKVNSKQQVYFERHIRNLPRYQPLACPPKLLAKAGLPLLTTQK